MNDLSSNFTPLAEHNKPKSSSFFLMNIVSFISATALVMSFFIYRQLNTPQTYSTKASEIPTPMVKIFDCHNDPNNISYPKLISVTADKGLSSQQQVLSTSNISSKSSMTFKWNPVTNAQGYYVMLSDSPDAKKGWLDLLKDGKLSKETETTFSELKPNKTYYFLIRSWSDKGALSISYPTPTDCKYALASPPLFEFNTQ